MAKLVVKETDNVDYDYASSPINTLNHSSATFGYGSESATELFYAVEYQENGLKVHQDELVRLRGVESCLLHDHTRPTVTVVDEEVLERLTRNRARTMKRYGCCDDNAEEDIAAAVGRQRDDRRRARHCRRKRAELAALKSSSSTTTNDANVERGRRERWDRNSYRCHCRSSKPTTINLRPTSAGDSVTKMFRDAIKSFIRQVDQQDGGAGCASLSNHRHHEVLHLSADCTCGRTPKLSLTFRGVRDLSVASSRRATPPDSDDDEEISDEELLYAIQGFKPEPPITIDTARRKLTDDFLLRRCRGRCLLPDDIDGRETLAAPHSEGEIRRRVAKLRHHKRRQSSSTKPANSNNKKWLSKLIGEQ